MDIVTPGQASKGNSGGRSLEARKQPQQLEERHSDMIKRAMSNLGGTWTVSVHSFGKCLNPSESQLLQLGNGWDKVTAIS